MGNLKGFHTQGELGTARAARSRDHLMMLSTVSSTAVEDVNEARGEPVWYQLYPPSSWEATEILLRRVEGAGCAVLVWTVDLLAGRNTETQSRVVGPRGIDQEFCQQCHEHRPGYRKPMRRDLPADLFFGGVPEPFTWEYVRRLKDATSMKLVLKGIVTREDAELAVENGADGVIVSNHGGRATPTGRASIESLPEVVAGVDGRIPVLLDGGIRRGTDIFKALTLGADAVGIGRPYVWGLAAFGQDGVEAVLDILTGELRRVMRQVGARTLDEITPEFLVDPHRRFLVPPPTGRPG